MLKDPVVLRVRSGDSYDPDVLETRYRMEGDPLPKAPPPPWNPASPLNRFLAPLTLEQFLSKYYRRAPFHFTAEGDSTRFREYFSRERLRELIASRMYSKDEFHLYDNHQNPVPLGELKGGAYVLAMKHVFERGGSVVLDNLDKHCHPVARLSREFSAWTRKAININSYYTPPSGQAFPWHWDNHPAFILQIHGEKRWFLFEPYFHLPLTTHGHLMWPRLDQKRSKPIGELTLRAGDMLYLPAGFPHYAQSLPDSDSLHLTVGMFGVTWHEVIASLVKNALLECENDIAFRQTIDFDDKNFFGPAAQAQLRKLLKRFSAAIDISQAEEVMRGSVMEWEGINPYDLENIWDSLIEPGNLGPDSRLVRTGVSMWVKKSGDFAVVRTQKRKLVFPASYYADLQFIRGQKAFVLEKLGRGKMKSDDRLSLVRTLILEGLLRVER